MWLFDTFRLDVKNQCLWRGDKQVPLPPKPFEVLQYLVEHAGSLVTQDELLAGVWPDVHVQPEVLRRYILEVRRALGDPAGAPRFIETIPKRGYRFMPAVTSVDPVRVDAGQKRFGAPTFFAIAGVVVALLVGGFLLVRSRPPKLPENETILLADFANSTGDLVFDDSLRQGLAVQLEQSPVLRVVSEERVQQTLKLMRRPTEQKLTPEVAREVCQRSGTSSLIEGSIGRIGTKYSLILRAFNCANGESLAGAQADADDRDHVLEALDRASSEVRKKLGESLKTLQRFDIPLAQASTSSLEALHAYSLGRQALYRRGDSAEAIPLFQRAVTLDPSFAMAYVLLGDGYWNLGEDTLASENIRKAYDLRGAVSEWEKLRIESEYHSLVTYNLEEAHKAVGVWAQTYPRDPGPQNRLGNVLWALGQPDKALAAFQAALRLEPESSLIRGNLIDSYLALNQFEDARLIVGDAKAKNPSAPGLRVHLYRLAFLEKDDEEMQRQVDLSQGIPGLEDELLWNAAATAAYFGQVTKARNLYRQAIAAAERAGEMETAAGYEAEGAFNAALFGQTREALQRIAAALRLAGGPDVQSRAALVLGLTGDAIRARALVQESATRFPEATTIRFIDVPIANAQVALGQGDAAKAVDSLQSALPYELGAALYPAYVRGMAFLALRRGSDAAAEFQKILDHRGIVLNSPIGALARLQLARALAIQGERPKARAAYQDFLTLWQNADTDIPILVQAKAESARLSR